MDTNNPIIKLCSQGIQAEMQGKDQEALELYNKTYR